MGGIYQPPTTTCNAQWHHGAISMERHGLHQSASNLLVTWTIGFFDLSIYAPQLIGFEWMAGFTCHSLLFLVSSLLPATLAKNLNPWLCATKQGLWPCQLPLIKQTTCIRWLLFSAPEYNLDELCHTILMATGVEVALQDHTICDNVLEQAPGRPASTHQSNPHQSG